MDTLCRKMTPIALLIASIAPAAHAQSTDNSVMLEEILVTAQRRAEASVDVPISLTTLSQSQLDSANIEEMADIARITPGLRFDSQGPAVQPTIRGIGTAVATSGGGPNVGIYVDGFFQANTYVNNFDLLNVESIQVLKGPQGTLFGRNTTGGAILVTSAKPNFETNGKFALSYGSYNMQKAQGYLSFGLSDNVAMDIEALYRSGDGFTTNSLDNDDKVGEYESTSLRIGVLANVSENTSVLLRYIRAEADNPASQLVNAHIDNGARFFDKLSPEGKAIYGASDSRGRPLVYLYAPQGTYETDPDKFVSGDVVGFENTSETVQLTIQSDLGFADLTSYTQYRTDESPYYGDLDVTSLPFFNIYVGVDDTTFSQEFVLNSTNNDVFEWTAGLNYFTVEDTWDVGASFGGAAFVDFGGSSTTTNSTAIFFDATYQLTEKTYLTAGVRASKDEVSDAYFLVDFATYSYTGADGNPVFIDPATRLGERIAVDDLDNSSVTPRLVVRHELSEGANIYASFTRGYKAGILNVGGKSQLPVAPEEIDAFEIGYKLDTGNLSFDIAAYLYDYTDLQFSSYQNGAAQIRNAKSSDIHGVEAQGRVQLTENFMLYGGIAWTKAEYESFENAPYYSYCDPTQPVGTAIGCVPMALGGFGPGAITQVLADASGLQMQRSPELTASVGGSYDIHNIAGGLLTLSGNLYFSSEFYFDASQQFKQDAFHHATLRAEWLAPSERFSVAVYGDNLTDERYQTQVLFNTLGIGSTWSKPRSFGISVTGRL